MRRPLIPVLLGYLSGILLESQGNLVARLNGFSSRNSWVFSFTLGYAVLLCLWGLLARFNAPRLATGCLVLLSVVIGITRYASHTSVPDHHIAQFVTDDVVTVEGMLYKPPESSGTVLYDSVEPNRYLYVSLTWLEQGAFRYRVCGNIRITLVGSPLLHSERKSFVYGDIIRTRLRLHIPQNAGDFDYQAYLRRRGIYLIGTIKHDRYIIKLPGQQGNGNVLLSLIYRVRGHILRFFDHTASSHHHTDAIQIIKAMTLGTSAELSPDVREEFRNAGMYHFLVVSGIHVGILVAVLHYIVQLLQVPLRYRNFFIFPGLLVFAGITGFQYPVLRAVIMASVLYFAITCSRVADSFYSLLFSISVIGFLSPTAIFEVSFQLTVAATASILLFYKRLAGVAWWERFSRTHRLMRVPLITMLISCSAMIGIAPLILFYFQRVSPYSILSNLVALPIIMLLLPVSLFIEGLSLMVPANMLAPLLTGAVMLAKLLLGFARRFPPFVINIPRPSPLFLAGYYIVLYCGLTINTSQLQCTASHSDL